MRVAPSDKTKLNGSDHSTFNSIEGLVRKIDKVVDKVSAIHRKVSTVEGKVMEQDILRRQLRSDMRTYGVSLNTLIRETKQKRTHSMSFKNW